MKAKNMGRGQGPSTTTAVTNGSTVMYSQMSGNLFPLHKLKGKHTSSTRAATVVNDMAEEDLGVKPDGEKRWRLQLTKR